MNTVTPDSSLIHKDGNGQETRPRSSSLSPEMKRFEAGRENTEREIKETKEKVKRREKKQIQIRRQKGTKE